MPSNVSADSLDILWTAEQMAPVIRCTPRQVHHMLTRGELPGAQKKGGRWFITRRDLIAAFEVTSAAAVK